MNASAPLAAGDGTPFERGFVRAGLCALAALPLLLDTTPGWLAVGVPAAMLVVDFGSGVLHWAFDRHVSPRNRLVGRLVTDFVDHHRHPQRTLEVGFHASAYHACAFIGLPLGTAALLLRGHPGLAAFVWSLAVLAVLAPQFHKLAHDPRCPRWIRALQDARIILSPRAHAIHHRKPQDRAYCITTGWCNPVLDAIGFWPALDRGVLRLRRRSGVAPR